MELAKQIAESPINVRYRESLKRIASDMQSRELLEKLIVMGRDISDGSFASGDMAKSEYRQLQEALNADPLVKKHLLVQREYLNLLQSVMDRIRNPRRTSGLKD